MEDEYRWIQTRSVEIHRCKRCRALPNWSQLWQLIQTSGIKMGVPGPFRLDQQDRLWKQSSEIQVLLLKKSFEKPWNKNVTKPFEMNFVRSFLRMCLTPLHCYTRPVGPGRARGREVPISSRNNLPVECGTFCLHQRVDFPSTQSKQNHHHSKTHPASAVRGATLGCKASL